MGAKVSRSFRIRRATFLQPLQPFVLLPQCNGGKRPRIRGEQADLQPCSGEYGILGMPFERQPMRVFGQTMGRVRGQGREWKQDCLLLPALEQPRGSLCKGDVRKGTETERREPSRGAQHLGAFGRARQVGTILHVMRAKASVWYADQHIGGRNTARVVSVGGGCAPRIIPAPRASR